MCVLTLGWPSSSLWVHDLQLLHASHRSGHQLCRQDILHVSWRGEPVQSISAAFEHPVRRYRKFMVFFFPPRSVYLWSAQTINFLSLIMCMWCSNTAQKGKGLELISPSYTYRSMFPSLSEVQMGQLQEWLPSTHRISAPGTLTVLV